GPRCPRVRNRRAPAPPGGRPLRPPPPRPAAPAPPARPPHPRQPVVAFRGGPLACGRQRLADQGRELVLRQLPVEQRPQPPQGRERLLGQPHAQELRAGVLLAQERPPAAQLGPLPSEQPAEDGI